MVVLLVFRMKNSRQFGFRISHTYWKCLSPEFILNKFYLYGQFLDIFLFLFLNATLVYIALFFKELWRSAFWYSKIWKMSDAKFTECLNRTERLSILSRKTNNIFTELENAVLQIEIWWSESAVNRILFLKWQRIKFSINMLLNNWNCLSFEAERLEVCRQ